ncbi:unnamed protein product [Cuscuta epithymum]|uniref:F-box associated beta-propeller type 1 domain-containing protein n=1 Tax=Cuscuta epithymum TaxID=186058 RepID=A0AAV0G434_9ASTE|nr:unnamed protein product [Cuscuta epithymum]
MQLRRFQNNPFIDSLKHASIVGSSNGLLCVLTGLPGTLLSIYVCNPAIREVIEMPRSPSMDLPYIPFLGFAFSPTVNDYKIVIPYVPRGNHKYAFEAYSVTTNSWKNIGMGSLKVTSHPFGYITFNGSMFWFTS